MLDEGLTIAHDHDGALVLRGEIDAATANSLDNELLTRNEAGSRVVLEMSGVTFIDSSGLYILVEHRRRLDAKHGRLELRSPSETVVHLLELTGLAELFGCGR